MTGCQLNATIVTGHTVKHAGEKAFSWHAWGCGAEGCDGCHGSEEAGEVSSLLARSSLRLMYRLSSLVCM